MKLSREVLAKKLIEAVQVPFEIRHGKLRSKVAPQQVYLDIAVAVMEIEELDFYSNVALRDHFIWQSRVLPLGCKMDFESICSLIEKTIEIHPAVAHLGRKTKI